MGMQQVKVWDWPTRLGHWILAASFIVAYLTAESERWRLVHVISGCAVLGIVLFRLLWGFIGSRYARFSEFVTSPTRAIGYLMTYLPGARSTQHYLGHNPAGGWSVVLLLLGAGLAAITGLLAYHFSDLSSIGEVHEWLANGALALVGVHVLGVVVSSWAHKENLLMAMFTGNKNGPAGKGIASTHVLAAGVMLVWTLGVVYFLR
jgi:cytochrome b